METLDSGSAHKESFAVTVKRDLGSKISVNWVRSKDPPLFCRPLSSIFAVFFRYGPPPFVPLFPLLLLIIFVFIPSLRLC